MTGPTRNKMLTDVAAPRAKTQGQEPAPTVRTPATAGQKEYVVVANDTLSKLALEAYGDATKGSFIRDANPGKVSGDTLKLGSKLEIPVPPKQWAQAAANCAGPNWNNTPGANAKQRPAVSSSGTSQQPPQAQALTTVSSTAPKKVETEGVHAGKGAEDAHPPGSIGLCPYHAAAGKGDPEALRQVAVETMKDMVFGGDSLQKAEKVALSALQADPADKQGKSNALIGLIMFREEKWGDAVKHLEVAVKRDPNNKDLADILQRAKTNAKTHIDRPLGPTAPFDGKELLESPTLHLRMPQGLQPLPDKTLGEKAKEASQDAISGFRGMWAGLVTGIGIGIAEKTADKNVTMKHDSWDKRGDIFGELEIGSMRQDLNKRLTGTYPEGNVGFQKEGQVRPEYTRRVRTANGSWNLSDEQEKNHASPMIGAAGTEFGKSGPIDRVNRAEDPTLPSAREVSRVMLTAKKERETVPFLNNLAIAWIQFQNHDWVSHGANQADGSYEVKLAEDDPLRKKYNMDTLSVPKTAANPLAQPDKLTHLNEITHWWDGSQVYGSDQATVDRLRQGADGARLKDGKMRIDGDLLPVNPETGVEDSGMTRNWWVGTDALHTLFVKEHNSICDELKAKHPNWSSDQLFETARLINAAEMAKIHTHEWTPAVLPNQKLVNSMNTNWYGAEEALVHKGENRKTVNPFQPKDPILGGLVGGKTDDHGVPYALSEEFTEVYRTLHAGMLTQMEIRKVGSQNVVDKVGVEATRAGGARDMVETYGMETILNSMGNQHMAALVNNNYPDFMQESSLDGNAVADIGTIDIIRARERGVPLYNEFRRKIGLPELKSFEDLGCDAETVKKLEGLYGKGKEGLEKLDLLPGALAEARRPDHFGFGETMFQVFVQMASRRLQADPFYTERYNAETYTQEGLDRIDQTTLKSIMLRHYPGLGKGGLAGVNNAFEPQGTTAKTHPEEHPLDKLEKY